MATAPPSTLRPVGFDPDYQPPDTGEHPSPFDLDCLVGQALPPDDAEALAAHAAGCATCAAQLAELQVDPPGLNDARVLAAVRRALDAPGGFWAWLRGTKAMWVGVAAAAGAAVAVFALRPAATDPQPGVQPPGVRMKGAMRLHVLRHVGDGAEPVASGEAIRPDDRLRFQVTLPKRARVTVVGVEPTGTLYTAWPLPEHGADPVLDEGLRQALPGAVSLEGPKGVEHLYLVACPPDLADPACEARGPEQPPRCDPACRTTPFRFIRP